jgi:hypothetical protein
MSHLEQLTMRLVEDDFFLASVLKEFAESEQLDEQGLANFLGCKKDILIPLYLCRRPRGESQSFRKDIEMISERFGLNLESLVDILRRADALQSLRGLTEYSGFLMAARDKENQEDEDGEDTP